MTGPTNEVYALRYAYRDARRSEHFYGAIDRPDDPMPISYFIWLIINSDGSIVIDTGFTAEEAKRRGRSYVMAPHELVRVFGVDPASIDTVVLTHLHYDHAGGAPTFVNARFVLQEREMAFWTGRHAALLGLPHLVVPEDVSFLCQANFESRIEWVDGTREIRPGVTVHWVGGHTAGMQIVSVRTATGTVVLASDSTHFYENIHSNRPYSIVDSIPGALDAFVTVRELATNHDLIIPGHDPEVLDRFPRTGPGELAGHVVRIA
jgi:glyoxylase-like metal-dependent hydrolase (beta-lactamase superfamily II)